MRRHARCTEALYLGGVGRRRSEGFWRKAHGGRSPEERSLHCPRITMLVILIVPGEVAGMMPRTCFVTGCRSGFKGTDEDVSLLCFPGKAELSGFTFGPNCVLVCENRFRALDILRAQEYVASGDAVSMQPELSKPRAHANPWVLESVPVYY